MANAEETKRPLFSVVTVVQNNVASTIRCLQSVLDTCKEVGVIDTVLIDNGSTDDTKAVFESLKNDVHYVHRSIPALPDRAWAQGIEMAVGEYVLLITNDIVLLPGWLEPAFVALAGDETSVAVTPSMKLGDAVGLTSQAPSAGTGVCLLARMSGLRNQPADFKVRHVPESVVELTYDEGSAIKH